jgi:hypothetical protein
MFRNSTQVRTVRRAFVHASQLPFHISKQVLYGNQLQHHVLYSTNCCISGPHRTVHPEHFAGTVTIQTSGTFLPTSPSMLPANSKSTFNQATSEQAMHAHVCHELRTPASHAASSANFISEPYRVLCRVAVDFGKKYFCAAFLAFHTC